MNFLYPSFLWALFAVLIPLIIHLFNFRRYKTVYFSNVKYLQNIKKETKSKSQLKHWLIMLARMLTIAALVIAFAQPYKPATNEQQISSESLVALYVDNSFSMDAEGQAGSLFSQAVNSAHQILNSFPRNTRYIVLTNDFNPIHQHLNTKERVFDILTSLKISSRSRNISEIYSRAGDLLLANSGSENNINRYLFVISDFQKSTSNLEEIDNTQGIESYFIPLVATAANNLFIDSVYFDSPARKMKGAEDIFVKLVNNSGESYNDIPVKLLINGQQKALSSFSVSANSSTEVKLSYTNPETELIYGEVEITDYPVTFDNRFFFSYSLSQKIDILEIFENKENKYIKALLADNDDFVLNTFERTKVSISELNKYKLIILSELKEISSGLSNALKEFVHSGGTLLVLPGFEADLESYNLLLTELEQSNLLRVDTLKTEVKTINTEHEIFKNSLKSLAENVKLPELNKYFRLSPKNNTFSLLKDKNDNEVLTTNFVKNGRVYLSAFPFNQEAGNFVNHKLFVPVLFNVALYSQNVSTIYYSIGKDNIIEVSIPSDEEYNVLHVQNFEKTYDFIPELIRNSVNANLMLDVHDNITEATNYQITDKEKILAPVSFNYRRKESILQYFSQDELDEFVAENADKNFNLFNVNEEFIGEALSDFTQGVKYWKYFLILALLFILAEILLIRVFRK